MTAIELTFVWDAQTPRPPLVDTLIDAAHRDEPVPIAIAGMPFSTYRIMSWQQSVPQGEASFVMVPARTPESPLSALVRDASPLRVP